MENFKITVDDGRIKVPVQNLQGDEVGVFYFNPADVGIIERFNEMAERIQEIVKPIAESKNESNYPAAIKKATQGLYDAVDTLFAGSNASEAFFGKINPFSPCSGKFYFENVLNSVGEFISSRFDAETKKINARMSKYTRGLK